YIIVNDFGCVYTQEYCFNILPEIVTGQPRMFEGCANLDGEFTFDFKPVFDDLSTDPLLTFTIHTSVEDANEGTNSIPPAQTQTPAQGVVTYWVRVYDVVSGCFKVVPFTAEAIDCSIPLVFLPDMSICEGEVNSFNLAQYIPL